MSCRATQDGQAMMERSDKTWSTKEGNGKPLQHSCLENPKNNMTRQKYDTERWTPQVDRCPICYWRRVENNSKKNEETEPKQKEHPGVDVTGEGSKV